MSVHELASEAVGVREFAKSINKSKVKLLKPTRILVVSKSASTRFAILTRELARSDEIDCIITLGGDGTLMYAAWLFQSVQVPPIIPFHLGSLGFLTVYDIRNISSTLSKLLTCSSSFWTLINLRMRLKCSIWRLLKDNSAQDASFNIKPAKLSRSPNEPKKGEVILDSNTGLYYQFDGDFHILNEMVVDRGSSAFMSTLELYVDDSYLTTCQADGLIAATPTGSTAYSLSAGGSLVHPEIPAILLTPICGHSLSFRPILLPDSSILKIQIPQDSRSKTACASFDGRQRIELERGDYVSITMSRFPVPTLCDKDQSLDWFSSLKTCLHWNARVRQQEFEETVADADLIRAFPPTADNMSLDYITGKLFAVKDK